jgi:hypothetical protein
MKEIDKAFADTTKLLFGKELGPLEDYEDWLTHRIPEGRNLKSATSKKMLYVPGYAIFRYIPKGAAADLKAMATLSKKQMALGGDENLRNIAGKLKEIAVYVTEFVEGENLDVTDSTIYMNLCHAYKTVDCFHTKYAAYSFWSDYGDHTFAVSKSFNCKFSVKCYDSGNIIRSLEVDFSKNCSDVMFCHNCDNVRDSLFCFNTKNLKYAVGNVEIGKEAFMEVKKKFVSYALAKLEKEKRLDFDIYDIGCRK